MPRAKRITHDLTKTETHEAARLYLLARQTAERFEEPFDPRKTMKEIIEVMLVQRRIKELDERYRQRVLRRTRRFSVPKAASLPIPSSLSEQGSYVR